MLNKGIYPVEINESSQNSIFVIYPRHKYRDIGQIFYSISNNFIIYIYINIYIRK